MSTWFLIFQCPPLIIKYYFYSALNDFCMKCYIFHWYVGSNFFFNFLFEISEMETLKIEWINKSKIWFFGKINKINIPLASLIKGKSREHKNRQD